MFMLFISLTRKYKVIRDKVPFILQLTNYLFITMRNIDLPVKPEMFRCLRISPPVT